MFDQAMTWARKAGWRGFVLLAAATSLCVSVLIFVEVTDLVREGDFHDAERVWMRELRTPENAAKPIGPSWLPHAALDITALGGSAVLTLMTVLVAIFLLIERRYHSVLLLLVAALGGTVLNNLLKSFFGRERPDVVPHLSEVMSSSYPSGHSMLSSIIYLTLGVMLARAVESRTLKVYCVAAALAVSFLIGLTRVYLGVHYPTDVLGGWAAGTAYALVCMLVAYWLERRGAVEPEAGEEGVKS